MSFVHVHNHTEYSLLDGANRIPAMVARAKELGMDALAISDHGVMFGVMEFYFECRKQEVKPILGMEAYVAPNGLHQKTGREENQSYHLLLLAKDLEGYRNLCKLHSVAALEGFYYKPRIDHDLLREHAKGLIGTSACLGSEICKELRFGTYDRAQYLAGMYKDIFDEDSFYIELQDHRLPEQAEIKERLLRIARELKLPLVATNDAHYLCRKDSEPHDVLLCVGTGKLKSDTDRLTFDTDEFYLKSPEEMHDLFKDHPEALENTLRIAEQCNLELGKQRALMPTPEMPAGYTPARYLRELAEQGLADRYPNAQDAAWERLNYELSVIEKTAFDDYFLLVREFANFTRSQGIYFGVRGSAAGSLVSYTLGITDVDPLEYDLTFERFLNPERISMPDIDMDFEDARRDEVIRWVSERYGADRVAQIVTFGTLGAKAAIKDSGRVLGYSPQDTDRICKTIPNTPGMNLEKAYEDITEFRQMVDNEPQVKALVEVARSVEGLSRHCGVHAAGIVIAKEPLSEIIPLYRGNDGQPITAFEMGILDKIGLLKMDFLGLSNLTVLAKTLENVNRYSRAEGGFTVADIPLDDAATFDMLSKGDTVGVFQLESGGMRRNIIELKPQSVKELAAMVALYRPGPMPHIPTYINNKHGRTQPVYLDERMKPILEETYGVIVYQDQVLRVVQALAGFSLGKADILRRAMGKKDAEAMDSMKVEFIEGARARGVDPDAATQVWVMLEPFAGYAFNKAHAVCYALLAYQTAYLKANFPVEYMAALLAAYRSKEDRVTAFIEECRRQKIAVLPPSVNLSGVDFTIEEQVPPSKNGKNGKQPKMTRVIRFGLAAIKGVGEGIVEAMIRERENGPFTHLYEFCERMKGYGLNRAALDALIKAGALEEIDKNRRKLLDFAEAAMAFAETSLRNRQAGQESLFGEVDEAVTQYPALPEVPPLTRSETLAFEKEVLGIYVSDHPLRGYEHAIRRAATHRCDAIAELEEGTNVRLSGLIASIRPITTKKGDRMATFVLEDLSGQAACTLFAGSYAKFRGLAEKDKVVSLNGVVTYRDRLANGGERTIEVRVDDLQVIDPSQEIAFDETDETLGTLIIRIQQATRDQLFTLRNLIEHTPGYYGVVVQIGEGDSSLPIQLIHRVDASPDFRSKAARAVQACQMELIRKVSLVGMGDWVGEEAEVL